MLRENYSFATWVYAIYRALHSAGIDADTVMKKANFDYAALSSNTQQVPKKSLMAIWNEAERVTGDDAFALRVILHVSDPYVNALVTSAQSCSTIKNALDLLLRYYRVVLSGARISASVDDTLNISIQHIDGEKKIPSQDVDIVFGMIAKYGYALPFKKVRAESIQLTRAVPKNKNAYQNFFGCAVSFDCPSNVIRVPKHVLELKIPSASSMLSSHVQDYLSKKLLCDDSLSFSQTVEKVLIEMLPNGTPKLRDVAYKLNLSERSLQRKLQNHGLCFSSVLRRTRLALARKFLNQPDCNIERVAEQLGFTEASNFIRFFKQQTGETPLSFAK